MDGEKLSLEQFSALLNSIDSGLGPAANQLWKEGVDTEALLRKLTKQDMHMADINLGNRVLIYVHFHPTGKSSLALRDHFISCKMQMNGRNAKKPVLAVPSTKIGQARMLVWLICSGK